LIKDELEATFSSLNLCVIPTLKTHHAPNSSSRIDLLVCSHPILVDFVQQHSVPSISRHDILHCQLRVPYNGTPELPVRRATRRYKLIDTQRFAMDVLTTPWGMVLHTLDLENKVDILNNLTLNLFDKHAPLVFGEWKS